MCSIGRRYPPIIDKELFDIVQDVLQGKARPPMKLGYKGIDYIFRGLIRCGTCGCTITPETHKTTNGNKHTYLRCFHLKGGCKQGLVKEEVILNQLEHEIFSNIKVPEEALKEIKTGIKAYVAKESDNVKIAKKNLAIQLTTLKTREEVLDNKFLDGDFSKEKYESMSAKIKKEQAEVQEAFDKQEVPDSETAKTMIDIVEIAASAGNLMRGSCPIRKRVLLGLILTNQDSPKLNGVSLCYSLKKPFDKLLLSKGCKTWLGWLGSNQRHTD